MGVVSAVQPPPRRFVPPRRVRQSDRVSRDEVSGRRAGGEEGAQGGAHRRGGRTRRAQGAGRGSGLLPTGRVRRTTVPAALALRTAASTAAAQARAFANRDATARDALLDERLVAAAERTAAVMGDMKGAVMKVGQLLSFVDVDLVPEQYRTALAALQADAPPMPLELVRDVVTAELGAPPEAVFDWFSPEPIAAASIGQVHLARLDDGAGDELELVVKVQYPGVAEAIEADLANSALISLVVTLVQRALGGLVPKVDARAVVEEIRDRIGEELDYRIEAENQAMFAELWAGEPRINVPAVVPELSAERVLTMEYVDAMRWSAAVQQPVELRNRWGEAIALFVFGSLYRHHVFNADPHPGNYLFHEDGTVTFLDFGCVKRFDAERVRLMRALADAARTGDDDTILQAVLDAGLLRGLRGVDRSLVLDWYKRAYEPRTAPQPFTYTRAWAASQVNDLLEVKLGSLGTARQLDLPADMVFLGRITAGLNSVLAGLEATVDWDELDPLVFGEQAGEGAQS